MNTVKSHATVPDVYSGRLEFNISSTNTVLRQRTPSKQQLRLNIVLKDREQTSISSYGSTSKVS